MKNLGSKFKEAREARNVSLRDAADMTKIRTDVLQGIEDGNFDFDLPEVYKRGFIRLYAQFLRMDQGAVISEYSKLSGLASLREHQPRSARAKSMDSEEQPIDTSARYEDGADGLPDGSLSYSKDSDAEPLIGSGYLKIGAVLVALLVAVAILVSIFNSDGAKQAPAAEPSDASQPAAQEAAQIKPSTGGGAQVAAYAAAPSDGARAYTVIASADTYVVAYEEGNAGTPVLSGLLEKDSVRTMYLKGPLLLHLTDAQNVKLEVNGKLQKFGGNPTGQKNYRIQP